MLEQVWQQLEVDKQSAVDRLKQFLSIASVSTDPSYSDDVQRGAEWVAANLKECGFDVEVMATGDGQGHPVVLGRSKADAAPPGAPRVLFYGHYDVQPPDPLDLWQSPPFEPTVREGAIYARGASDDKGQVCCFLETLRAWKFTPAAKGKLPCHVTVLIEGEEEMGSIHLPAFLEAHREQLAADVVVISDTTMWESSDGPRVSVTYGLRGLAYFDVQLHGPNRDLHSGMFGGTLANPAVILSRILGKLFDDKQRVTVPGFYDDVAELTEQERQRWAELDFDEQAYLGDVGVSEPFGEAGYSTLERKWVRPSCDINGLYGGYGGAGAKTIIPSFAGAKVSFRLAPNQDPAAIADNFEAWLRSHQTAGCTWRISRHGEARAVVTPADSPHVAAATRAIERAAGHKPAMVREGASIPVVADFKTILGLDSLLIGFGRMDDRIHSPNEKFELACLHLGARTHAAVLAELAELAT